jgi:hypothetical protein
MIYISPKHNYICEFNTDYTGQYYYILRDKEGYSYSSNIDIVINSLICGYGILIETIEELEL